MNTLVNKAPFIRILLPVISGILVQNYLDHQYIFLYFLFISLVFFIVSNIRFSLSNSYKFRWFFGCGVSFLFMGLGAYSCNIKNDRTTWELPFTQQTLLCQVTDFPVEKPRTMSCQLNILSCLDRIGQTPTDKNIIAYLYKDSLSKNLIPGDYLLLKTTPVLPSNKNDQSDFDYAVYLKQQGFCASGFVKRSDLQIIRGTKDQTIKHKALLLRQQILTIYEQQDLSEDQRAVLSAITLGYKNDLTVELKQKFSTTGASHILAVSGLHVGIIYMMSNFILFFLRGNKSGTRILKQSIIIILIWSYAFITGLSPSVVRASIMISLIAVAVMINRRSFTLNTLCISATGMLLYNPYYLFDVGFQLSYSAVLSIVTFQLKIKNLLTVKYYILKPVWSLTSVSIAAQIGTFPIVLYYFHQFPVYFLLTNLLVIPATYLIILLAVLLFICYLLFSDYDIISYCLKLSLHTMNKGIDYIECIPYSSIRDINTQPVDVFFMFILMLFLYEFCKNKKYKSLIHLLSCILILVLIRIFYSIIT